MSYDVHVGDHWSNITSNMRPFFDEYVGGIRPLHGITGHEMAERIDAGLPKIIATPVADLDEYNAPDGWGTWPRATQWLMELRDAGRRHPADVVDVSA